MESQRKRNKFFKSKQSFEDRKDVMKLREEIRLLRKAIHDHYTARWNRMKKRSAIPVRYDSLPEKKIVISHKTDTLTCVTSTPNTSHTLTHEIEANIKIHELSGSYAEWISEDEMTIHFNIMFGSNENEKFSMRLKRNDDLWNLVKGYIPMYVNTGDIFGQLSIDLTFDEVRTITKNIRDSCFSYQHRRNQFEVLKAKYRDCTISMSANFYYRYINIQLRMIHSKENKAVFVCLEIMFHSNSKRPYDYLIESEDLSSAEKAQLKIQLEPLLEYDLCYGLQVSMLKREESIFILEGSKSNIESGSSAFDNSKQTLSEMQESEYHSHS